MAKTLHFDLSKDVLNQDWLRASRLKKEGTPEALAELKAMENDYMVEVPVEFNYGPDKNK